MGQRFCWVSIGNLYTSYSFYMVLHDAVLLGTYGKSGFRVQIQHFSYQGHYQKCCQKRPFGNICYNSLIEFLYFYAGNFIFHHKFPREPVIHGVHLNTKNTSIISQDKIGQSLSCTFPLQCTQLMQKNWPQLDKVHDKMWPIPWKWSNSLHGLCIVSSVSVDCCS